ncbi:hypothetical protein [Streptomyces sp. AC555_RSS877]|uniref:hypothetical protein n=1 Tax=Streptomyces sp. AC555_RSS877 TaxID=2823688 RepID=UPI0020B8EE6F|nr:hypothetical protein [Streptomyces sp. AC555_RSS877]
MLVRLSPAQRDLLLDHLHFGSRPVRGSHTLRTALDTATLADQRYGVDMSAEMVEAASFLLRFASAGDGPRREDSRSFDAAYILGPRQQTHRERLMSALAAGAEIREVRSFHDAAHRPRHGNDPEPWVITDTALNAEFRLPDDDVHPVWPLQPVLVISDSLSDDPVGLHPCRVPLRHLPSVLFTAKEYQLAPLVLLDDRSYATFKLRHMPRRPGLIVVCADLDDASTYPRGAVIAAEAVLRAGQDLSWLHLRMHDATECQYLPLDDLLTGDISDPPPPTGN